MTYEGVYHEPKDSNSVRIYCMVFINTRVSPIPYLIDQFNVFRILLFNWLIPIEFVIKFLGQSRRHQPTYALASQPLYFLDILYHSHFPSILKTREKETDTIVIEVKELNTISKNYITR